MPNVSGYTDRIRLLEEVSKLIGKVTLLVGVVDAALPVGESKKFVLNEVRFVRGFRPLNLWRTARAALAVNDVDIFHDTSGNLILVFLLLFRRKLRPALITSFFALEKWRIENVWKRNGYSTIRLLLEPSTRNMYFGAFIQHIMALVSDRIVLQSAGLFGRLTEYIGIDEKKISALPNNVDCDFWRANSRKIGRARCFQMLYVGGLDHSRGVFAVLEALGKLKEEAWTVNLVLVVKQGIGGEGPINDFVARNSLGNCVEFVSGLSRREMLDTYNNSDVLVYQTINDGSPRVVLEALSCGLPVVASHHPGINVLDPGARFIKFTDYSDVDAIVRNVSELFRDNELRSDLSEVGQEEVRANFSSERVAKQYANFYQNMLSEQTCG